MKRDYDKIIKHGNIAQREKFAQNEHKPGFNRVTLNYVHRRIKEELIELEEELLNPNPSNKRLENIRAELADISNFAHMGIYSCDQELCFEGGGI